MYSLRRTLAVRFSCTMFLGLVLITVWAFLDSQRNIHAQLEDALSSALALELGVLASGHSIPHDAAALSLADLVRDVNRFVVARDARGNIVDLSTPLAGSLPLDAAAFAAAVRGETGRVTADWNDQRIRSVYATAPVGSPTGFSVVQVAASLEPLARENGSILFSLAATVLVCTVITAFGAIWLAGSAVRPVQVIAEEAATIRPGVRGQRITAHADVTEFQSLITVLNSMLDRLDRANAAQRRMIADVGHDLRTPLTAARGQIEIALRANRSAAQYRATLTSILEEVDHLSAINEALILLARIEAGQLALHKRRVDLAGIAESAVRRAGPRAEGRLIRFHQAGSGSAWVLADESLLGIMLDHLLDNAVRHTPAETTVEAVVSAERDRITVAVRDNGAGISPELLPHLFERFYRTDPARTRTAGPGLGLTVAAAIAEVHEGHITATNVHTGGLDVTVSLAAA